MNRRILLRIVLVLALLGGVRMIAGAADTAVPPLQFMYELDIIISGPNTQYYVRLFPDGKGDLARGSQLIGSCPRGTFDFAAIYHRLSILPRSDDARTPYVYHIAFRDTRTINDPERLTKGIKDAGGNIRDTKVIREILGKFADPANSWGKNVETKFVESPPFAP